MVVVAAAAPAAAGIGTWIAGITTAVTTAYAVNESVDYLTGESITERMDLPSWSDVEEMPMKVALFAGEFLIEAGKKVAGFIAGLVQSLGIGNAIKRAIASFFQMMSNPAVGSYLVAILAVLFSFIAVWGKLKSGAM